MTQVYPICKGLGVGDVSDSIESLKALAREHGPGRDLVDERLDACPVTKVSARAWGKVIHHRDGRVDLDPIPWPA